MKTIKLVLGLLLVGALFALPGCGKKGGNIDTDNPPMVVEGVNVDVPKLIKTLESATPEQQASARNLQMAFRYRQYEKALMEIDKLANDATLNEEQKSVATNVLEQVKQVVAKAPPAPAQ
jgi:hypothetical protein